MASKQADLAGPGISTYEEVAKILPNNYRSILTPMETMRALFEAKRNLDFLTEVVQKIWKMLRGAYFHVEGMFPQLKTSGVPPPREDLYFIHAEDLLAMYPDLPRKQRETEILKKEGTVFIYGIGWVLADGYPHEMRAADYDDWITPTTSKDGRPMHGLNGDILVWNHITKRRHELTSMGIRVTKETLRLQMKEAGREDELGQRYHQDILKDRVPLSIGGGIGQSRVYMYLLKKAHLGEVSVTVWPDPLREICSERNIHVLE